MAYRRRRTGGTTTGMRRKTSRRAFEGLRPRRRRNTRKGSVRKTARRAFRGVKRRRRRRNPLFRTTKGRYTRRRTRRKLSKYRKPKRGWHNPRHRRRKVRYSRNPLKQITGAFEEVFSMDTLEQVLHTGVGFAGAIAGTNLITDNLGVDALKEGWGKVGATAGVAALGSGLIHMITKDARLSKRVLVGGMLATLLRALGQVIPADSEMRRWVPTLGNRNGQFRRAIERQVLREMRGSGQGAYYMPAAGSSGLNSYYMPAAGSAAYLTPSELQTAENRAGFAGMGAYLTQKQGSEIDQYGFAGMGYKGTVSEFGNAGAVRERF